MKSLILLLSLAISALIPTATAQESIFSNTATPAVREDSDAQAVELGMKFQATRPGVILGVKFFKGPQNTGTHTGSLWSANGQLLARVEFTNETASGWQTASFATPIRIASNTTYVVSYFAPRGRYSLNSDYFQAADVRQGNLVALRSTAAEGNGVYVYSTNSFPRQTWKSSNYWVDVLFRADDVAPPPQPTTTQSLWQSTDTPSGPAATDTQAVEIGLKFRASVAGQIRGLRFFKAAGNGGTHIGRLWSRSGQLLATATFTNETATGWQQASFPQPIAIQAGQIYIASYHAPQGRYSFQPNFFNAARTRGALTALSNAEDGGNGVFRYGPGGTMPTQSYQAANYWVDVEFEANTGNSMPPAGPTIPAIVVQPADTTVTAGQTATFAVAATSAAPLSFQWRRNNVNVPGATSATYTTPATTPSDNNTTYSVELRNSAGPVTSRSALLTVNLRGSTTSLSVNPTSINAGATAQLTATVALTALAGTAASGRVEFLAGSSIIGSADLNASGVANLAWKAPDTPASLALTARFTGSPTVAGSTSNTINVTVLGNLPNVNRPPTEGEAARFLSQATFGPTKADVDRLMQIGYDKWFEEQFGPDQDPTYIATLKKMWVSGVPFALAPQHRYNYSGWYSVVVPGRSQLRLRMEWALSQIFVVSNQSINSPQRLLYHGDLLRKHAFGTYRTLLDEVTWSAQMGNMLTYVYNFWTNTSTSLPDQNMARELMQLFSIGLWELNPDGSQKLRNGKPIPTYSSADIVGLSHVFTGLGELEDRSNPDGYVDRMMNRMTTYSPGYRSQIEKKFLGVSIPCCLEREATPDIKVALDTVEAHPNVAPFLSKQLIQRFVSSNPSPAYVGRVAAIWNNNGKGVRGDLKAVLRAILMDPEARDPKLAFRPEAGKIREFALRLANFYRILNIARPAGFVFGGNNPDTQFYQNYTSEIDIQHPYNAPTVFNWYRPGFAPAGSELDQAGLVAPEMQITTTDSILQWSNFLKDSFDRGGVGSMAYSNPTNRFQLDEWTSLASDTKALVDRIDLLLFAGQMSSVTRQAITQSVQGVSGAGSTAASRLNRVKVAFSLAFVAPDYIVQK